MPNEEILKTQEAAALLGAHIETIRRMARKGDIPAFKIGKDWRFKRSALLAWADVTSHNRKLPHVLVVDDDPAICKSIRRVLEPRGYILKIAHDGIRGFEALFAHPVNLVLLDLNMPAMDGVDFLKHLRETDPGVPVIIITGYPESEMMARAIHYGPILLLPKPFGKEQLVASVEAVLRRPDEMNVNVRTAAP